MNMFETSGVLHKRFEILLIKFAESGIAIHSLCALLFISKKSKTSVMDSRDNPKEHWAHYVMTSTMSATLGLLR